MRPPPDPPAVLLLSLQGAPASTTLDALRAQTVRPRLIVRPQRGGDADEASPDVTEVGTFGEAVRVSRSVSGWIWLLDAGTAPDPRALQRLLDARAQLDGGADVALLASRVLDSAGRLDRGSLPVPDIFRADRVLLALDHRLVALRAARYGSLLVDAKSLQEACPAGETVVPAAILWTARILKHRAGMLVPESVVRRVAAARSGPGRVGAAGALETWRLMGELEARERVRFITHLAREISARRGGRE